MKPLWRSMTVWGGVCTALGLVMAQIKTNNGVPHTLDGWVILMSCALSPWLLAYGGRRAIRNEGGTVPPPPEKPDATH